MSGSDNCWGGWAPRLVLGGVVLENVRLGLAIWCSRVDDMLGLILVGGYTGIGVSGTGWVL